MREHAGGVVIEPGDVDGLVSTLLRLASEREALAEMGARAPTMLESHFTRQQGLERWRGLLDSLETRPEGQDSSERVIRSA